MDQTFASPTSALFRHELMADLVRTGLPPLRAERVIFGGAGD
jgi:hypothetical protein